MNEIFDKIMELEYVIQQHTGKQKGLVSINVDPEVFDMLVIHRYTQKEHIAVFRPSDTYDFNIYGIGIEPKRGNNG